jgi:RNA-binding protein YlmH
MKKHVGFEDAVIADANVEKGQVLNIDIGKCYQFKPEDFEIDVTAVRYSNSSFIQVMDQDVFVDFLEIPGVKKEGKMIANATRIYMTHVQAKKLVETLGNTLESSYKAGRMETYQSSKK